MKSLILILNIIVPLLAIRNRNLTWDYEKLGPDVWSKTFKDCDGHSQSPINIQTACTISKKFPPFLFIPLYKEKLNITLENDGHTITAKYNGPKLPLRGGDLPGDYQFVNFHLHWGPNENVGSEHQVNGVKYTGEIHFVYENVQTGKLAVLGFFMKSQSNSTDEQYQIPNQHRDVPKTQWQRYFDATQNLIKENDTTTIDLTLSLLMGENLNDFWRYNGSLTIPPCTEDVIWTVFKEPIYIYDYEFVTFRDDLLFESYRGPQSLYRRKIYRSFEEQILSSIPEQNCCLDQTSKTSSFFSYNNRSYFYLLYLIFILVIFI